MTIRYYHKYSACLYPVRAGMHEDKTVYEQAEDLGGKFVRITAGLPNEITFNFNPTLAEHEGKTWIAWRAQPEPFCFRWDNQYFYLNNKPTDIYIGQLANNNTIVGAKPIRNKPHKCSYEDPRFFADPSGGLYLQFVASTYASKYARGGKHLFDNSKVIVGRIDERAELVDAIVPDLEKNRDKNACEKNWCFFNHNDELHILYSIYPLKILHEYGEPIIINSQLLKTATGDSPTFCSTAPINLGSEYLIFYHWKNNQFDSSRNWYLKYYTSAFTVDKKTFEITGVCEKPLFYGSLADQLIWWTDAAGNPVSRQPATILPYGALLRNDKLLLSVGVNDAFMGVMELPVDQILRRMTSVIN